MKVFTSAANRQVSVSVHSRIAIFVIRRILRPLLGFMVSGSKRKFAVMQFFLAARHNRASRQANARFEIIGQPGCEISGQVFGDLRPESGPVLLWLHGGAWVMPIIPENHIATVGRLRQAMSGSAFIPEYRLLPSNPYPASLDDCERAYQALLALGYAPENIVVAGDSAGGNMLFALLHRLKKQQQAMPACVVGVAPVTDLACFPHGSASRVENVGSDAVLPVTRLTGVIDSYCGDHDRCQSEISPLYGDLTGFPPTYLVCSAVEVLRDDSVLLANKLQAAGCQVKLDIWSKLPHIFPLCEDLLPEARQSREDIASFILEHLSQVDHQQPMQLAEDKQTETRKAAATVAA